VPITRKARGRKLQDQKANSVADMAAALRSTTMRKLSQEEIAVERRARKEKTKEKKARAKEAGIQYVSADEEPLQEFEPIVNATVKWTDILDAEFAESWPATVVHDRWETGRYGRKKVPKIRYELAEVLVEASPKDAKL
jgi:hypothetical protein